MLNCLVLDHCIYAAIFVRDPLFHWIKRPAMSKPSLPKGIAMLSVNIKGYRNCNQLWISLALVRLQFQVLYNMPEGARDHFVPFSRLFCEPFLVMHADAYSAFHQFTNINLAAKLSPGPDPVDSCTACRSVDVSLR